MNTIEKALDKVDSHRQKGDNGEGIKKADASGQAQAREAESISASGEMPAPDSRQGSPRNKNTIRVNFQRLETKGIFAPDNMPSHVKDELRRIKRPLLSNAFGKGASLVDNGNLIVVTSSLPGEGKTFTAVNLALSISLERDHTVLLIDADAAKSDATHLFGLEKMHGLSNLLLDKSASVGDVLVRTDIPDLTILPSGPLHPQMTELLASNRMEMVVAEIAKRYHDRVIIIDAPPVLATSEAHLLTQLAGQIAFVVRAADTPQHVVQEAVETLDKSKAIGLVLNQTQNMFGFNYSSYGYYGYGERGGSE